MYTARIVDLGHILKDRASYTLLSTLLIRLTRSTIDVDHPLMPNLSSSHPDLISPQYNFRGQYVFDVSISSSNTWLCNDQRVSKAPSDLRASSYCKDGLESGDCVTRSGDHEVDGTSSVWYFSLAGTVWGIDVCSESYSLRPNLTA